MPYRECTLALDRDPAMGVEIIGQCEQHEEMQWASRDINWVFDKFLEHVDVVEARAKEKA